MHKKMLFLALALTAAAASFQPSRVEAGGGYSCPRCVTYSDGSQCCVNCWCGPGGLIACNENYCVPEGDI